MRCLAALIPMPDMHWGAAKPPSPPPRWLQQKPSNAPAVPGACPILSPPMELVDGEEALGSLLQPRRLHPPLFSPPQGFLEYL